MSRTAQAVRRKLPSWPMIASLFLQSGRSVRRACRAGSRRSVSRAQRRFSAEARTRAWPMAVRRSGSAVISTWRRMTAAEVMDSAGLKWPAWLP